MFAGWSMVMGAFPMGAAPSGSKLFIQDLNEYLEGLGFDVYPGYYPQDRSTPGIVYFVVSTSSNRTLKRATGLMNARYQFEVICSGSTGTEYPGVVTTSENLRQALDGFKGLMGTSDVLNAWVDVDRATSEPPVDTSDSWTYRRISDVWFVYRAAQPYVGAN